MVGCCSRHTQPISSSIFNLWLNIFAEMPFNEY
ncbi:Uncharacterised protein [Vibrio cholerae]|nr:Uncharacterised protein [Vibrio cholerae]